MTVLESGPSLADPVLAAQVAEATRLPIGSASALVRRYRTELTTRSSNVREIVRGATLGGSGAVNGGYFCRGLPDDFADFPAGWSWPQVLQSYRAIETDRDFHGPQHGDRGPIPVQRSIQLRSESNRFIDAMTRFGFDWIDDLNDSTRASGSGVGLVPLNIIGGVRVGPGAAYLIPALGRPNVTVRTGTRALRLVIQSGRAVAVEAIGEHGLIRFTADRIMLCAGAIGSAHLLMLSGIGEPGMLRDLDIVVHAALPVGVFADHPEWLVDVDWPGVAGRPVLETVLHHENLEIRPYSCSFAAMVGQSEHPDRPHIGVALMRPQARGRLSVVSADPRVPPRIEHRYDTAPADLAALRRGVDLVGQVLTGKTEAYVPRWSTSQHLCGTAPLGADGDETAVLDPQCRVRGIDGLWVIDGSALPRIVSRGPHATIAMLAHRATTLLGA